MINPTMPRNISFRTDTLFVSKNNRVGRIKPDNQGIYHGLPMMVLGQVTQQDTYYEPQSIVQQITDPNTTFNKIYRQQKLYGEYGHPRFYGLNDSEKLQRLVDVEEKQASHLFTGFYTDKPSPDGTIILRSDLKPAGPYGPVFKESLDDPVTNTAFSLRAFVDTNVRPDGVKFRTVRKLTTFDTVGPSGFATSDKANSLGLESFSGDDYSEYEISVLGNGNLMIDQLALESFTDTDINEIFGVQRVSQIIQSRTIVESDRSLHEKFPTLYRKSVFNDFFRES